MVLLVLIISGSLRFLALNLALFLALHLSVALAVGCSFQAVETALRTSVLFFSSNCPVARVRIEEFHVNFRQMEVPLLVRYEYGLNRLKPFVEAGVNLSYLMFSRYYEVSNDQKGAVHDRDLLGPGRLGVTASLSLGAAYSPERIL